MNIMLFRICFSVALLLSVLFMPFWASVILALGGMLYFHYYLEALLLFFISDLLYGASEARFFHITFGSLVLSSILFTLAEFIKRKSIFYKKEPLAQ